jgi:hypothetical protein
VPEQDKKQICSIRIMFPTISDEQAIEYKKKISTLLAEIPDANIQFSLMTMPTRPVDGSQI